MTVLLQQLYYDAIIIPFPTFCLGVSLQLRDVTYANNSDIKLKDIGEAENALLCKTELESCCRNPPKRAGEFYYPDGSIVPINLCHKSGTGIVS